MATKMVRGGNFSLHLGALGVGVVGSNGRQGVIRTSSRRGSSSLRALSGAGGGADDDDDGGEGPRMQVAQSMEPRPFETSFDVADGDFFEPPLLPVADPVVVVEPPAEKRCQAPPNSGTVMGAVALITGSTVGAGILALPQTIAPAGIGPSSAVLVACWTLLVCEALLLAEVNVAVMRERDEYRLVHGRGHSPVTISLSEMAGRTLGPTGAKCTTATYLFLSTTLLVAYIAKGGVIVSTAAAAAIATTGSGAGAGASLEGAVGVDPALAALGFAFGMGGLLSVGGVKLADKMNQVLTLTLLGLFGLIVLGGAVRVDWTTADWGGDWSAAPATVPVVFLALVYHDLVPVICSYLAGDMDKIRRAIVLGSTAPLVMFLSWDAVALGLGGGGGMGGGIGGGDPLSALMQGGDGLVAAIIAGFSLCAISTSFIGTSIGLSEFAQPRLEKWAADARLSSRAVLWRRNLTWPWPWQSPPWPHRATTTATAGGAGSISSSSDVFVSQSASSSSSTTNIPKKRGGGGGGSSRVKKLLSRVSTYTMILVLPTAVAATNPDVFLPATSFAGAYGMTTMFGILPPVMALSMRAQMAEREARSRARYAAGAAGTEAKEAKEEHGVMDGADERWYDVLLSRLGLGKKDIIGDIGDLKLGWLSVPTPRMMSTGVPGGPPALAALSFSAFAITLGQLRNDLNKGFGSGGGGQGVGSAADAGGMDAATAISTIGGGAGVESFDEMGVAAASSLGDSMLASIGAPDEAISATAAAAAAVGYDAWDAVARLFH